LVCQIKHELAVLPVFVAEGVLALKHRSLQRLATMALKHILDHLHARKLSDLAHVGSALRAGLLGVSLRKSGMKAGSR